MDEGRKLAARVTRALKRGQRWETAIKVVWVFGALAVTHVVASLLAKLVVHVVKRASVRNAAASGEKDDTKQRLIVYSLAGSSVYWAIMAVVLLLIPGWVGMETTAIVALLGSLLFAVGLGVQGTLADLAAGVMLICTNTFRLGDYIEVPSHTLIGTVVEFGVLYTRMLDEDSGVTVVVPNRVLYENSIVIHSSSKRNIVVLEVVISNRTHHLQLVLDRLRDAVAAHPKVIRDRDFPVTCNIAKVDAFGTMIEVRIPLLPQDYQVSGTHSTRTALMTLIRETLSELGVPLVDLGSSSSSSSSSAASSSAALAALAASAAGFA